MILIIIWLKTTCPPKIIFYFLLYFMRSNPSRFKKNIGAVLLLLVLFGGFFTTAPTAEATGVVSVISSVPSTVARFLTNLYNKYKDVLQQAGSRALQLIIHQG